MSVRISERLKAARRRLFVGRGAQKKLLHSAVTSREPPFFVMYIHGPGGVGKTTLLHELAHDTRELGAEAAYLDLRTTEVSPDSVLAGLAQALGGSNEQSPLEILQQRIVRTVLLLDTCEVLAPFENWLRESFLPELPATTIIIMAGRHPPSHAWTTDPSWQSLLKVVPLRNLSPDESMDYLNLRTVSAIQHSRIVDFTHGHPLAISLVADVLDQHPDQHFEPLAAPNIIQALLERLVQEAPSRQHRATLEAACLALYMTEGLLAAMLNIEDANSYFQWLRSLSFMEAGRYGLFPHDLVRETMATDLRWRNPDRYAELHRRARSFYHDRLRQTTGFNQRRILAELVFLHRDSAAVRQIFEFQVDYSLFTDHLRPGDSENLLEMVYRHEGPESVRLAEFWLDRQPQTALVIRNQAQQAIGFVSILALQEAAPEDLAQDPATKLAWEYIKRQGPLRSGEQALYFRFWMDQTSYQDLSTAQNRIFLNVIQYYLVTPGLACSFFVCANPRFYYDVLTYADINRLPELDFTTDGRRYGVFYHDWRLRPPVAWLNLMAEREIAYSAETALPPRPSEAVQALLVLSQAEFGQAAREALRNFTRPDVLESNPLIRSRLVMDRVGSEASNSARARTLHQIIGESVDLLQSSPRQLKLYRALYHTYIRPATTQELAAELLNIPFSTYRRHLKDGIENVVATLWAREVGVQG